MCVRVCVYLNSVCHPPVCGSSPSVLFSWHQARVSSHSREMSISLHIHTLTWYDSRTVNIQTNKHNCFGRDVHVFICSSVFSLWCVMCDTAARLW